MTWCRGQRNVSAITSGGASATASAQSRRACASMTSRSTRWSRRSIAASLAPDAARILDIAASHDSWRSGIARWRVTLGFAFAALVLWLASPTWRSLALGGRGRRTGEALRVWAAGHVEKSREVTRSGPYRFTRHPLYLGSWVIGVGHRHRLGELGGRGAGRAVSRERRLPRRSAPKRRTCARSSAAAYDAYASRTALPMVRSFSAARALGNREHHALAGPGGRACCAACAQGRGFRYIKVCAAGWAGKSGRLAQLVEHRLYTPGVTGSSPVPPIHDCVTWRFGEC